MTKYERNYIGWYLRENYKKVALILVVFFMAMPFLSIVTPSRYATNNFQGSMITQNITLGICGIALAYGMAIYNFRYLMNKRAASMYLAMPITKDRFFLLQYALGAVLVFTMPLIMYVIAICIDSGTYSDVMIYLVYALCCSILHVVLYTFFVFVGLYTMLSNALRSTLVSFVSSINEIFPMITILEFLSIPTVIFNFGAGLNEAIYSAYYAKGSIWQALLKQEGLSIWFLVFWVVVAVLLYLLAKKAYNKRACEESEQRTNAYICYPFLSLMVTISLLLSDMHSFSGGNIDFILSLPMIIVTFVIFLVMNFFARRKIIVTKQMMFSFVGVIAFVFTLNYACIHTKGFGRIEEIPIIENVKAVSIRVSYGQGSNNAISFHNPNYQSISDKNFFELAMQSPSEDDDIINTIYALQEDIVSENANYDPDFSAVTAFIDYTMKNGTLISRGYSVSVDLAVNRINPLVGELVDANLCGDLRFLEVQIRNSSY